jgi:hypothetical protein
VGSGIDLGGQSRVTPVRQSHTIALDAANMVADKADARSGLCVAHARPTAETSPTCCGVVKITRGPSKAKRGNAEMWAFFSPRILSLLCIHGPKSGHKLPQNLEMSLPRAQDNDQ